MKLKNMNKLRIKGRLTFSPLFKISIEKLYNNQKIFSEIYLVSTLNPRPHGKPLKGNLKGIWRYRVSEYRLLAEIEDDVVTIIIFEIEHRRKVYKRKISNLILW
ncbi:hypothetical protein DAT1711_12340 [Enterococcus cecorum]